MAVTPGRKIGDGLDGSLQDVSLAFDHEGDASLRGRDATATALTDVTAAQGLQLAGLGFEVIGVGLVAWGIAETRQRFGRLSSVVRARDAVGRFVGRFRRPRPKTVKVGVGAGRMCLRGSRVRGRVTLGDWNDVSITERLERVKGQIGRLQDELSGIHQRLDREEEERRSADQRHDGEHNTMRQEVNAQIEDVAAGGLRRETIGVLCFLAGLAFQGWGVAISPS